MRVIVDLDLCQGHGQCEDAAPDVFEVGDDALAHLRMQDVPASLRATVEDAARRCPTEAISLVEEG